MQSLPVIGITMGDPSGIGPEIIIKALGDDAVFHACRPVVFGDAGALTRAMKGLTALTLNEISNPSEARARPGRIDLLPLSGLDPTLMLPGRPTVEAGRAMVGYILRAVEEAKKGTIGAMVTCPISKAQMHRAGYPFPGHTQLIAQLTGTRDYVMMLAGDRLRVALVTIHCALKDVPSCLSVEEVAKTIFITERALRKDFALQSPVIAVTALNPHGGEEGLFGMEEETIIKPAIARAVREGCRVEGPLPADTLFWKAAAGDFQAVVAMYHDQGLIPLKLLHFSDAVNITLGLPIIRTSVDHGTAYDIAGKGAADPSSLKAAIRTAAMIAENRKKDHGR